jgi:hypothetical protein
MPDDRDLNRLKARYFHGNYFGTNLPNGAKYSSPELLDHAVTSYNCNRISVHFDKIEDLFISLCGKYEVIIGAVAWLTNQKYYQLWQEPGAWRL